MLKNRYLTLASLAAVTCTLAASGGATVTLMSGGSTFIYPILVKWTEAYRKLHPDMQMSYDPVGSGKGISRTLAGTVDFGASDGPLTDVQISASHRKLLHIPVVLGAVVPAYKLPGVTEEIRFTPKALAGIFLGTIKRWNDPELARANPDVHLPGNDIQVVFRTDGSGTTYVWTDYLSKVSDEWRTRVGRGTTVPFIVGEGAQFNECVMDVVKKQPYSIGYLQITYAVQGHVHYGRVQNSSGTFAKADSASITAAAAATAKDMPDDFRTSITNATDADAYPISSFTWLLVPAKIEDRQKHDAIVGFLRWILTDGQKLAAPIDYAPLPGDIALRALRAVDRIQ
jgi:phosphate transport system substrate-binding protein